jgi:hypothetical protein
MLAHRGCDGGGLFVGRLVDDDLAGVFLFKLFRGLLAHRRAPIELGHDGELVLERVGLEDHRVRERTQAHCGGGFARRTLR